MRRDLEAIYVILQGFIFNEMKSQPTIFVLDRIPNEEIQRSMTYFAPMLVNNGFARKVEAQADFSERDCYRITWKGHCFLDLYEYYVELHKSDPDSQQTASARIALLAFF